MTQKKIVIWLLGAVIFAVGGYHVVAGDPKPEPAETQSYTPRPAQSSALLQIPDDMSIIESDERTKACMADIDCVREIFLKWTFGNNHEGPPPEHKGHDVVKALGPMIVSVVGAESTSKEARDGFQLGLTHTIAVLRSAGMSITTSNIKRRRNAEPLGPTNIFVFVSDDFYRDQHGRFTQILEEEFYDGHETYREMLERQNRPGEVCTFMLFSNDGNIVDSATIMIPSDLPRGEVRLCFYQEIIQALGPAYDFRETLLSTFTDNENVPWFSDFDYMLTRLFFHPTVRPGMSREEIVDIFPDLYRTVTTSMPFCLSFDDCLKEFF